MRLARALQAMQRMSEAMRLLHHERRNYPECQEMQRLAESTRLALRFLIWELDTVFASGIIVPRVQ